jgi:hypothetical protein
MQALTALLEVHCGPCAWRATCGLQIVMRQEALVHAGSRTSMQMIRQTVSELPMFREKPAHTAQNSDGDCLIVNEVQDFSHSMHSANGVTHRITHCKSAPASLTALTLSVSRRQLQASGGTLNRCGISPEGAWAPGSLPCSKAPQPLRPRAHTLAHRSFVYLAPYLLCGPQGSSIRLSATVLNAHWQPQHASTNAAGHAQPLDAHAGQ